MLHISHFTLHIFFNGIAMHNAEYAHTTHSCLMWHPTDIHVYNFPAKIFIFFSVSVVRCLFNFVSFFLFLSLFFFCYFVFSSFCVTFVSFSFIHFDFSMSVLSCEVVPLLVFYYVKCWTVFWSFLSRRHFSFHCFLFVRTWYSRLSNTFMVPCSNSAFCLRFASSFISIFSFVSLHWNDLNYTCIRQKCFWIDSLNFIFVAKAAKQFT